MKIIEWNCQGAFRLKNERVLSLKPDIMIIPECENAEKLEFGRLIPEPNDFLWFGDSLNKGIGIFSYSDYRFELLKAYNPRFRYIIPIKVTRQDESFLMLAVWAMDNKENPDARYIGQIWLAINYYSDLIQSDTLIVGDFNSNQIWDYKDRIGNHTDVVNLLKSKGIQSMYHFDKSINHGQETDSTFFMYRKQDKAYHIDYCFASNRIFNSDYKLTFGSFKDWIDYSDHIPMIIDVSARLKYEMPDNSLSQFLINRLDLLQAETKDKFAELIEDLIYKSKETDKLTDTNDFINQRKVIIDNVERLFEIDKLIKEINKNVS